MKALLSIVPLLAACGSQGAVPAGDSNAPPEELAQSVSQPQARPFAVDQQDDLIEFHYGWSAEAAEVPELVARFTRAMAEARAELVGGAEEDRDFRREQGFDFHGHMSSTDHETAGQTGRLLSLMIEHGSYTGGAHGNFGVGALLWDRAARKELKVPDLFTAPDNMSRLLTQRWCDALNAAREEKRGEPVGTGGLFDDCPALDEIAIIPADRDGNGRFEMLLLVASPYVAGPWVEGSYEIELAVTPELLTAIKGQFRPEFESFQTQ